MSDRTKTVADSQTFTISQLAREFDVTTRTIRFYEEKGLVYPRRQGSKRLYSASDRVRIKLILRGRRIGMSLDECMEVIDLYDPAHGNREQLQSLMIRLEARREKLRQQKQDIEVMLQRLEEVARLCEQHPAGQH
ncbi:MAG: MerR family DNA-binding transcriptional regulator [Pseudomonadota bacterium]